MVVLGEGAVSHESGTPVLQPAIHLSEQATQGAYGGTSLIRNRTSLGPYLRPMP